MITRQARRIARPLSFAALATAFALLAGCERPQGMESSQNGYRGTAMGQVTNPRVVGPVAAAQTLPEPVAAIPAVPGSPLAKDVYKNVQVLGELPAGEFTRTMLAITAWVAPKEGCNYCHAPGADLSEDKLYTKVVARKMLAMNRQINTSWGAHVGQTGVTCYTCHRGQAVPAQVWFTQPEPRQAGGVAADSGGQNRVSLAAGTTSLGIDPLTPYLLKDTPIRSNGTQALPHGLPGNIRATEGTFGLMFHMSQSLGVNCTYCHNTRAMAEWSESPPQHTTAWHGIRMARALNNEHMVPLTGVFPAERKGPLGDVAKVGCATCHQGLNKPLKGAPMAKDHAEALSFQPAKPMAATPGASAPSTGQAAGKSATAGMLGHTLAAARSGEATVSR